MTIKIRTIAGGAGRSAAVLLLLASAACNQQPAAPAPVANAPVPAPVAGPAPAQPAAPAPTPATDPAAPVGMGTSEAPAAPTAAGTDGRDRRLRVTNESGQRVTLIKGSSARDRNWGRDRIPTGTLPSGNVVMLDFNDGNGECVYDLQATMEDGTTRETRGVNICTETDWVITRSGAQTR